MELAVTPDDLYAAAVALGACARRLDDAAENFARSAARDVPDLGRAAVGAAGSSAQRADDAVTTISADLSQLARALKLLAELYADVDRAALPLPRPLPLRLTAG